MTLYDVYDNRPELAVLVGARQDTQSPIDELSELVRAAGASVAGLLMYGERTGNAAHFIGKGKLEELALMCRETDAGLAVFNDNLSGIQIRNLEKALDIKVIDRTGLILDIFAKRARTHEGNLQVELAQLNYRLSRLTGIGGQLSRLGGGIGTRGPGEKQLDIDRRHIRRRINQIEAELKKTRLRRERTRGMVRMSSMPVAALVGYTNSGKSTLFNTLCGADTQTEDMLFATLDPTSRRLELPGGGTAIAVDTVGFISKLPHELVDAFKATLEETTNADILIHVVDISNPDADVRMGVVENLLKDIGAGNKKTLIAFNKADLCDPLPDWVRYWRSLESPSACVISALSDVGTDILKDELARIISEDYTPMNILIPYGKGDISSYVHEHARILREEYVETGVFMTIEAAPGFAGWLKRFEYSGSSRHSSAAGISRPSSAAGFSRSGSQSHTRADSQ